MIVLYHCLNARSFRPLWALEELGLPYDLRVLPFPPRAHERSYLSVNPFGTIPLLLDGDTAMTESVAICEFLATRYGPTTLRVQPEETEYGSYLNWLYFGEATLTFPQTLVLRYGQLEPTERRQPQVVEDYRRWFLGRLRALESALAVREHLCAGRFTLADISVGYALLLATDIGLGAALTPNVCAYWDRLRQGAAFQRALAAQDRAGQAA